MNNNNNETRIPLNRQRAKHYAFTCNNYTDEHITLLLTAFDAGGISYLIFGEEVGASGTPHLQGHVSFTVLTRGLQAKAKLSIPCDLSVARNIGASINYCKKDGLFTELGTPLELSSNQGKRNDLDQFKLAVKGGICDLKRLREEHSSVFLRCKRFCLDYLDDNRKAIPIPDHPLHSWQSDVLAICNGPPNDRTIVFVVDVTGGCGKSWLCSFIENQVEKAQVLKASKRDDMAYALSDDVKVLLVDVPRCYMEHLSYQFLEDVKDGRVFSPKYESRTKRFLPPHVIVFCNEDPNMEKLSADRYSIVRV